MVGGVGGLEGALGGAVMGVAGSWAVGRKRVEVHGGLDAAAVGFAAGPEALEEARVQAAVVVVGVIVREVRHAEGRVDGLLANKRRVSRRRTGGVEDRLAPTEAVPFDLLVLSNDLHLLLLDPHHLLGLFLAAGFGHGAEDGGTAADGIGPGLVLGFFLFGDGAHLVEIAVENSGIGNVLG